MPLQTEIPGTEEVNLVRHPNRSADYRRTEHSPMEKAFADTWEAENKKRPGINYGHGILQDLFYGRRQGDWPCCHHILTNKERMVAATAIQWLGSPVGSDFLERCLKKAGYRLVHDPTVAEADIRETLVDEDAEKELPVVPYRLTFRSSAIDFPAT